MVVKEKIMNGWHIILYDPNDLEKEDRSILIDRRFKSIKEIYDVIRPYLLDRNLDVSYITFRKMCHVSYNGINNKIYRSLSISKCKIKVLQEIKTRSKSQILELI